MAAVEKSIEVDVPVRIAYNQWTQFEEFPSFMEGVQEVEQLDDTTLHWRAEVAGKQEEWDAEITHQVPDQRIAWRSKSGARNDGTVTFEAVDSATTRVTVRLEYDPEGVVERVGNALGVVSRRVEGDLKRFKEFVESRGTSTGAWRGAISEGRVTRDDPTAGSSGSAGGDTMSGLEE